MTLPRTQRGFTLVEMVIVIAIIGILAAVAYPSYLDSIRKAKRAEGKAALTRILQAEERYYTANNVYVESSDAAFAKSNGFSTYSSDNSGTAAYSITATFSATACGATAANQCIVVTATAAKSDPLCGTLTVNSAGGRSSTASGSSTPTSGCW
jgi:type IV pilus assembly protein PilE